MKKIGILQSNYIPWKGYFDLINQVDEFILFDEMQYTRNDWRNRNKIKTNNGTIWLSIPVETKNHRNKKISEITIADPKWAIKHWTSIKHAYSKAPYFKEYEDLFRSLYSSVEKEMFLSKINYKFIQAICNILRIDTTITFDRDYGIIEGKTERLVDLCKRANGSHYISGPAAKDYLDESLFQTENINVSWMDYSHYATYPQIHGEFEHAVSILDVIFNCGQDASLFSINHNIQMN